MERSNITLTAQCGKMKNLHSEKIQGDPNQNLIFQMAISKKICISDPMLVKPKCVLGAYIYFHFSAVCLQFSADFSQFSTICSQFSKIDVDLPNAFLLYQYGVRNAYFQSYSHLN